MLSSIRRHVTTSDTESFERHVTISDTESIRRYVTKNRGEQFLITPILLVLIIIAILY